MSTAIDTLQIDSEMFLLNFGSREMVKSTCHGCCQYQLLDCELLDVVFWKVALVLWDCI